MSDRNNKLVVPLTSGTGTAAEVVAESRWVSAITYRFDTLQDAKNYCSALERHLRLNRLSDVLVDARKHEHQTREATDTIWNWVDSSPHLVRMALVVESENLSLAIRMRSLASPVRKVRPFRAKLEAEKWLLSGEGVNLR